MLDRTFGIGAAPAILFVAGMMAAPLAVIGRRDPSEYAPAVVTAIGMPPSYSIATGIGLGPIAYVAVKLLSGRFDQVSPAVLVIGAVFVLRFALVRGRGAAAPRTERKSRDCRQETQNACGLGANWAHLLRKVCAQVVGEERGTKHLCAGNPCGPRPRRGGAGAIIGWGTE